ncbi:endolytic transglycosylase MltG [Homoserinimonas hongtaonis]|uniref:Endolytic murein transglycosylase n=1 Tax=Homoserinimonas hongtaonis TaxID=2079791 RepID=A0A2U1SYQ0_9MICO|nr:endolytic transglycosylase MltG [Salinibacterium hongtaonis]PWB96739.1 endolytic transglycosylase MltG [Salinibacterium hongtaonis]
MAQDHDGWEALLTSPSAPNNPSGDRFGEPTESTPRTRREAKAAGPADASGPSRPPSRRKWLGWLIAVVVILGLGAGSVGFVWLNFEDQVRKVMGWEIPPEDYTGAGTGETSIVIKDGDNGEDITRSLLEAGVIKSFDAFYALLLKENPSFYPGNYVLAEKMSARAALDALLDPANRVELTALVVEGKSSWDIYETLSAATEIPVADFEAAAADLASFGLPPEATSLEGYLFPARYTFQPGMDAHSVLQTMVDRMRASLTAAGVAPADEHRVLTIASLIQREAGSSLEDFAKVSRVIQNRIDTGMKLQFDSTAHYGWQWAHGEREESSVFSTSAELKDDNPYNTYVHTGLPPGPIGAPGDDAIAAALNPAPGDWVYFVTVNLDTGETVFSVTGDQHNAAVKQLQNWCKTTKSPNCG